VKTTVPIQIRFGDVDLAGHVHNAVYLHWFESARMACLERLVPVDHDWKAQGLLVARNEVDYRAPVHLHDAIEAEAWCGATGNKSFDLRYAIVRLVNGTRTLCAEGRSVLVCYDHRAKRTIPLPDAWRTVLEDMMVR